MDSDSPQIDERKALRKAFLSSLLARMNPLLILRSYDRRGEGPVALHPIPHAKFVNPNGRLVGSTPTTFSGWPPGRAHGHCAFCCGYGV